MVVALSSAHVRLYACEHVLLVRRVDLEEIAPRFVEADSTHAEIAIFSTSVKGRYLLPVGRA